MIGLQDRQFDALGDATRRTILRRLRRGPLAVGELANGMSVSRPAVSQHLRILKEANLVRDSVQGRNRYYSLDPRGFTSLRRFFDDLWVEALEAFQAKVEDR
jgi:DNA-binding transcriptional ArsR family regulator